jgi:exonuclease III
MLRAKFINMLLKIRTLNLCLGLSNKKDLVKNLLLKENIDILCLQETEIEKNVDHNLMSFPGYQYESDTYSIRSMVGCYITSSVT